MAQTLFQDGGTDPLSAAIQRLDKAVGALERRVAARAEAYEAALNDARQPLRAAEEDDLFDNASARSDSAHLAAELDAARARERALEEIAAEASAALGRAAAEVRAALSAEES